MNTTEFRAAVEAVLGCLPITPESNYPDWELQADVCPLRVSLGHGSVSPLTVFLQVESGNKDFLRTLGADPDTGKWNIVAAMFHNDPAAVLRELQRRLACVGYVPPLDAPMDLTLPADALLAAVRGAGGQRQPQHEMAHAKDCHHWQRLSCITSGDRVVEVMAATSCDGIGVIARWKLSPLGKGWAVEVIDTEGQTMELVTTFDEGEPVPPTPPDNLLELPTGLPALALTPEEKRLLTELLTNAVEIPVEYPAGGHMAAIVGRTQDTFRGLLAKLEAL